MVTLRIVCRPAESQQIRIAKKVVRLATKRNWLRRVVRSCPIPKNTRIRILTCHLPKGRKLSRLIRILLQVRFTS